MKKDKKKKMLMIVILGFIFTSCTCISIPVYMLNAMFGSSITDVTHSPEYNFASMAGTRWKTKTETALAPNYGGSKRTYLIPPLNFHTAYHEHAGLSGYGRAVTAKFPVGTHLRIEKLIKHRGGVSGVEQLFVIATLEDKVHSRKEVYLSLYFFERNAFLWRNHGPYPKTWTANPDLLESAK